MSVDLGLDIAPEVALHFGHLFQLTELSGRLSEVSVVVVPSFQLWNEPMHLVVELWHHGGSRLGVVH